MKTCTKCGVTKPLDAFSPKVQRGVRGLHSHCKTCKAADRRARKATAKADAEVYGYVYPKSRVQRHKGSRAQRIETAALAEIEALRSGGYMPTSNRFLYYRLEAAGVIPKGERSEQAVSVVMTELREAQVIEMGEIRDRSRGVSSFSGWSSVGEFVTVAAEQARLDRWPDIWTPILMVESNSLAGVLEDLAREYRCILIPLGGMTSCGLLGGEVAPMLHDGQTVLYLGDWDFSGGHIERSARERVEAYAGVMLDWRRVALTEEQVEEYGLTIIEKYDKRTKSLHPAVETEALDQRILIPFVRQALEALDPTDVTEEEQRQRAAVLVALEGLT